MAPATVTYGKGVLATAANGKSGNATIYGLVPWFRSARPGSDDVGTHVTFQTVDGRVLCHRVQNRNSPKGGCFRRSLGLSNGYDALLEGSSGSLIYLSHKAIVHHSSCIHRFIPQWVR